ncbi:MAG: hypothetical protein KF729_36855 [Sandaracinaceae bacterium]|nr:hypothetical protein [Sandaracinaceae bacterium]
MGTTKRTLLGLLAVASALAGCDGDGGTDAGGTDAGAGEDGAVADAARPEDAAADDAGADGAVDEEEITLGRLLVASASSDALHVVDLDGAETFALSLGEPETIRALYAHPSSRYVYAVLDDEIAILDTGVTLESHGGHFHVDKGAPAVLSDHFHEVSAGFFAVHGEANGRFALAFDHGEASGPSAVTLLQERTLAATVPTSFRRVELERHEGFAIVFAGHLFATLPPAEGASAGRLTVREVADPDVVETERPCTSPTGIAANGFAALVACAEHVLVAELHDDHFDYETVAYPASLEGARLSELRAVGMRPWEGGMLGTGETRVVARWGDRGLAIIQPASPSAIIALPIASPVVDFRPDHAGEHLVVLTADGNLHRFELADGAAAGAPIAIAGAGASSRLAVGARDAFVSVPAMNRIVPVEIEHWEAEAPLALPFTPGALVVATISPDALAHEAHEH